MAAVAIQPPSHAKPCAMLLTWSLAIWNADNPHVDLVVRGVADDGSDLVISRDCISHAGCGPGLGRARLQPSMKSLERGVEAVRWTRLEAANPDDGK
jgi:hypothetical protein